ncbi:MAG: DUF72 domain-containing protein [bacterium]
MNKWYIGTSGWYYEHWREKFYPQNLDKTEWLSFYAQRFRTVEINSTFYRLPFKGMITGWLRKTPPDFRFVIKGSRRITHSHKLKNIDDPVHTFLERITMMKEKMLCILWQLPPSLAFDSALLEQFLSKLPSAFRYAMEFRHPSWIQDKTIELLNKYNIAHCTISAPGFPCDLTTTTDFAYIRFHGIHRWYNYNYTEEDLLWWRDTLSIIGERVDKILVYFNNDYEAYAVINALRLKEIL